MIGVAIGKEGRHQLKLRVLHEHLQVLRERVLVLLKTAAAVVRDGAGVVAHGEAVWLLSGGLEALVLPVHLGDLAEPASVRAVGEDALLGEHREQTVRWLLDECHDGAVVLIR
eukprot:2470925-Prymnesium_polylepis.2